MLSTRVLTVDFGASRLSAAQFRRSAAGGLRMEGLACQRLEGLDDAEDAWFEATERAMQGVSARWRWSGAARFAVPGHLALTKYVTTPAIAEAKRGRIVQFEAAQNIPFPLKDVAWGHTLWEDGSGDLRLVLTAAKDDALERLCALAEANGCRLAHGIPACLALRHALRFNYPDAAGCVLLVNIGARSTHLVLSEGARYVTRTIALGGNTITAAIAAELQFDFAAAEDLKMRVLGGRSDLPADAWVRATIERSAQAFGGRLQSEVVRSLTAFERQEGWPRPAAVLLAGGGASGTNLLAQFGQTLQTPVARFEALRRVELAANIDPVETKLHEPSLGELVGLAVASASGDPDELELLPKRRKASRELGRRKPVLLAAAALVAAALLPPIFFYTRAATAARREAIELEKRLEPRRATQRQMSRQLAELAEMNRRIAALQRATAARSGWEAFLGDLQEQLAGVEDAWLEKMTVHDAPAGDGESPAAFQIVVAGCLLDEDQAAKGGEPSQARIRRLLESVAASPFIAAVEAERFDRSRPGLLRFELTLSVDPRSPL